MDEYFTSTTLSGAGPQSIEDARARAEGVVSEHVYLWKLVDVIDRHWRSEKEQAAPAPQVDVDFKLDDSIEAIEHGCAATWPVSWVSVKIIDIDETSIPFLVRPTSGGKSFWCRPSQVRRPVAAPAQPKKFEFGQRVRARKSDGGQDCSRFDAVFGMYFKNSSGCSVLVKGDEITHEFSFQLDQVFPL